MNPDHLLEQADALLRPPEHGPPRQADKRRAVSAAYYALFHAILRATADEIVGVARRGSPRYELVYRSISHDRLAKVCREVLKLAPTAAYAPFWPTGGFSAELRAAAVIVLELMPARHDADYSPSLRINTASVQRLLALSRAAISRLAAAPKEEARMFETLLLCGPRG